MRVRYAVTIMVDADGDLTREEQGVLRERAAASFPEAARVMVTPAGYARTDGEPDARAAGFIA